MFCHECSSFYNMNQVQRHSPSSSSDESETKQAANSNYCTRTHFVCISALRSPTISIQSVNSFSFMRQLRSACIRVRNAGDIRLIDVTLRWWLLRHCSVISFVKIFLPGCGVVVKLDIILYAENIFPKCFFLVV